MCAPWCLLDPALKNHKLLHNILDRDVYFRSLQPFKVGLMLWNLHLF
uniref:Uncharacterized protein n=1 Tax=Arundo donax TaxID=35708 RepID=A0A0A8Y8D5_ARUDO